MELKGIPSPSLIKGQIEKNFTVPFYGGNKFVPFILNDIQKKLNTEHDYRNIILKARKEGVSTLILAKAIVLCNEISNFRCVFLANNDDNTKGIFAKAKSLITHSSKYEKLSSIGKEEINFPANDSTIMMATAGRKTAFRGDDIHMAHLSEIAYFAYPDVYEAVAEAGNKHMLIFMESTANGKNLFWELWCKTARYPKDFDYKPFFFGWNYHPDYVKKLDTLIAPTLEEQDIIAEHNISLEQINWRRGKINSMLNAEKFCQEYPLTPNEAFLSSGRPVFNSRMLNEMRKCSKDYRQGDILQNKNGEFEFSNNKNGCWKIFDFPRKGYEYVCGADCCEGLGGGDFNAAEFFEPGTFEQVAEYHSGGDPDQFAYELNKGGRFFKDALLSVERNGTGFSVNSDLYNDYNYPHIYQEVQNEDTMNLEQTEKYGFRTNKKTRQIIVDNAIRLIRMGIVKLNSLELIDECEAFEYNEMGKPTHPKGKKDDRVMAMMIAINMIENYRTVREEQRSAKPLTYHDLVQSYHKRKYYGIGGYG